MFHIFTFQLQVVFWKWITPKLLGLVTQTSVYHWSIEGDSEPTKMFDRTANLANNQIINYRCDPAEKWLVLIGIAPGAPEVFSYINFLLVTSLLIFRQIITCQMNVDKQILLLPPFVLILFQIAKRRLCKTQLFWTWTKSSFCKVVISNYAILCRTCFSYWHALLFLQPEATTGEGKYATFLCWSTA